MVEPVAVEYVAARRVLLDAVEALHKHPDPVVLVGAQAIYVRTGSADFDVAVAPYTTDADLALNPEVLGADPQVDEVMAAAGFERTSNPGRWVTTVRIGADKTLEVPVDLMVPEAVAGKGTRSADLQGQAKNAARRGPGLEAALVDNDRMAIRSFDPDDPREAEVAVAGAAALVIAKAHKLGERVAEEAKRPDKVKPKDASDVYRLVQAESADVIGKRLRRLAADPMAGVSVQRGMQYLRALFTRRGQRGVQLAVSALAAGGVPAATVEDVLTAYFAQVFDAYDAT
ncbi:MAG TPA: hypothetical protein VF657_13455 [Actinoplanes sp.]|jgi:hypothetical protein